MVIIARYRKERRKSGVDEDGNVEYKIYIISEEDSICPICIGALSVIGSRDRILIDGAGDVERLVIRRLRCKVCGKIHHELPDIVIPFKRHCAETVESIAAENTDDVCCDYVTERRIRAWWVTFKLYFDNITASLWMKYGCMISPMPTPREMVRAVTNSNLWVHTRTAMTPT